MKPTRSELTPTSYAILGLLALRPWSAYELAQQMERALGRFWPRARSKLYEEPRKLVTHGLAEATTETVGRRSRTRYSITAEGERMLAQWVPAPGAGPQLEFEQLIKVFYAEHGTKADLLRTLEEACARARQEAVESQSIPRDYLEGRGAFPERLPWLILTGRLLHDFQLMVAEWAQWAISVVETWPDDLRQAEPDWETLEAMATLADSLAHDRSTEG